MYAILTNLSETEVTLSKKTNYTKYEAKDMKV